MLVLTEGAYASWLTGRCASIASHVGRLIRTVSGTVSAGVNPHHSTPLDRQYQHAATPQRPLLVPLRMVLMDFTVVGLGEGDAMAVVESHRPAGACAQPRPARQTLPCGGRDLCASASQDSLPCRSSSTSDGRRGNLLTVQYFSGGKGGVQDLLAQEPQGA
jgi:hypothetical protein